MCYIEVNGFYLGKLRGLLGDGNNEPYDDFRLPNGKVRLYFILISKLEVEAVSYR